MIERQADQWPHRTAHFLLASDMYDDDHEFYSLPVGHRTPRWNAADRPELPDGSRYFSPTEVNPHPNTWVRPDLGPRQYDISPHPALPLKTPGVKQHNSDFDNFQAVDRRPNTLYRGIAIDFDDRYNRSAPMDRIRRLLHGNQYEDNITAGPLNDWGGNGDELYLRQLGPGGGPGRRVMPTDAEAAAGPHPLGYDHPEIPHLLMQHLLNTDSPREEIHPDSLGTHWTADLGTAAHFAGVLSNNMRKGNPRRLSAILEGHWRGLGEDPYRRSTGGDFDEQEITLLRGAPLNIHQVHLFNPHTKQWHTHDMGGMERHAHRIALTMEDDTSIGDYSPGPMRVPETKSLPKYYDPDQGEYLPKFSPTGINPRPDTSARPSIQWSETAPPQDTLPLGVDAYRHIGDGEAVPVDRKPVTLYRGVGLNMYHPDMDRLRRSLYGNEAEGYGLGINTSYPWGAEGAPLPHPSLLDDLDIPDWSLAAPPRKGDLTDLGPGILDHLSNNHDEHELGRHWSLDREQAQQYASSMGMEFDHRIPLLLEAEWMGHGEDPYRRHTNGHWHDEQEVTMLPGAPLNVTQMHVYHPRTGVWHPLLDTPSPRTASRNR